MLKAGELAAILRDAPHRRAPRLVALFRSAADRLPLQRCCTRGGQVDSAALAVTLLSCSVRGPRIEARLGVFFDEVVGGCNCHDDPVAAHVYCELALQLDESTGHVALEPVQD